MVFSGGLIDKADLAKEKALLSEYEERIKIITLEEYTNKMIEGTSRKLIDLVKEKLDNEDWVSNVEKIEEDQIKVITKDKYIIIAKIGEDGSVEIVAEGKDDGEPYPSLTLTQEPYNEEDGEIIKIKVEAEVEKTSKTKKVTTVRIVKPERMKQEKEYTEGGVIFEVTENGVYTFEAETNMGKTKRKTIEINISKPESDIEITSEPTTPRNTESTGIQNGIAKGPINVEIKYGDNSYIKQYRKETDENWTEVNGTTANFQVTENIAIFARYSDGTNTFKTVAYNIKNVDNVEPNAFSVTETHTTNSITVEASTTDSTSEGASSTIAGILRYEYRIYKNNTWQGWQGSNTFIGLMTGTYKVQAKAIDKAGNETLSDEKQIQTGEVTSAENGAIVFENLNWSSGKANVTIKKTTSDSLKIRYKVLNSDGTERISYKEISDVETISNLSSGEVIVAQLYDGVNGGKTTSLNIQDNTAPKKFEIVDKNITTSSIVVSVSTTDNESGLAGYRFSKDNGNTWSKYQTSGEYKFTDLIGDVSGVTYQIKVEAKDNAENTTVVEKNISTVKDEDYYIATENELLETIGGRNFYKANNIPAIAGIMYYINNESGNWTVPLMVSTNQESVQYYTDYDNQKLGSDGSVTYKEIKFYYSSMGNWMPENQYSSPLVTINNSASRFETMEQAATELLNRYFYGTKDKEYEVFYNANGGTGAPSKQTKVYGANLTLSEVEPTRTEYTFMGWAESNNATTATYVAGATYTKNASTTLYAVWKPLKGAFIKYDVEYTDAENNYEYTSANGWRLENYELAADGKTLSNVRLISTGVPATMNYYYDDTTNNYSKWITNSTRLEEFKSNVLGTDYAIYTESATNYALHAATGFYYNLGQMTFVRDGTYNTKNQGYYTKIKNGSTTYTSGAQIGNDLFKARNDAEIRMLTLSELNGALGRDDIDNTSTFSDETGLYQLNKISTGTVLTIPTDNIGWYWLASPWPDTNDRINLCAVAYTGDIYYDGNNGSGIRPVISLTSRVQLVKKVDSTGFVYYEMVNVS